MRIRKFAALIVAALLTACGGSDEPAPTLIVQTKTFASAPMPTDPLSDRAQPVAPVAVNGTLDIVAGTSTGIYVFAAGVDPMSSPAYKTFAGAAVHAIVASPSDAQHLVALTEDPLDPTDAPVYRSLDGGATWSAAVSFPTASGDTRWFDSVAFDPQDTQRLYASLEGGAELAVSADGGANWSLVSSSFPSYRTATRCHVALNDQVSLAARRLLHTCTYLTSDVPPRVAFIVGTYAIDGPDPAVLPALDVLEDGWVVGSPDFIGGRAIATGGPLRTFVGVAYGVLQFDGDGSTSTVTTLISGESAPSSDALRTRAVWTDPTSRARVLFGGGHVADDSAALPLYEHVAGQTLRRWQPDAALASSLGGSMTDVEVEQVLGLAGGGFYIVVSHPAVPADGERYLGLLLVSP